MVGMNLLFQFLTILFAANTVLGTNMIILNNSFTEENAWEMLEFLLLLISN